MNTRGWTETALGTEIELLYGKGLPSVHRCPGPFPVFGSNGKVGSHNEPLVDGPGIIVGRKGSIGRLAFSDKPFWPIDTTYYVRNSKNHNWRFLYYLLESLRLDKLNSHSAVPGLNREDVYRLIVSMPARIEQDRIAAVLQAIELARDVNVAELRSVEETKRSALTRLFTHGLRGEPQKETEIGPIPQTWSVKSFSDVREFLQYGTSQKCHVHPGGYPVLRIPNVVEGSVDASDLKYCEMSAECAASVMLAPGDLLFIRTNGVLERLGRCALYQGEPKDALFASYLIRARVWPELVDPGFVRHYAETPIGSSFLAGRASPAADGKYNINTKTIDSMQVPVPPTLEEQQGIAEVIEQIDHKIGLHRRKQALLEELFRALLHKLMTGEVRVADLDLKALAPAEAAR
jgi:type I restriction enzyme S subunit